MNTYKINITEIHEGYVWIEAETRDEAIKNAKAAWWDSPGDVPNSVMSLKLKFE